MNSLFIVLGCPAGCECDSDFTCSFDVSINDLKCRSGFVSTGADCVGEQCTMNIFFVIVNYAFEQCNVIAYI